MKPHILIIGAGIIGSAIAHRLAPKARVTVLEAATPASLASGGSFGWINASVFHDATHHRLRAEAIAAWHRLGAVADVQWTGTLWWEEAGQTFDTMAATLCDLAYPLREIAAPEFRQMEPNVATPPDRSLLFPAEGAVDAAAQTARLLSAAGDHGAQLWTGTRVTGLAQSDAGVIGVLTDHGPVFADHVILATGSATEGLLAPVGIALPMLRRPGVILQTNAVAPVIHHVLVGPQGNELRQDAAGHLLAPATLSHQSDDSDALAATPGAVADAALSRIAALLPGLDMRRGRVSHAMRPVPADGLPAVGRVAPGLTVAVMHSGVTLAALMGELVADEVLGQGRSPWLGPYRPDRFA